MGGCGYVTIYPYSVSFGYGITSTYLDCYFHCNWTSCSDLYTVVLKDVCANRYCNISISAQESYIWIQENMLVITDVRFSHEYELFFTHDGAKMTVTYVYSLLGFYTIGVSKLHQPSLFPILVMVYSSVWCQQSYCTVLIQCNICSTKHLHELT